MNTANIILTDGFFSSFFIILTFHDNDGDKMIELLRGITAA